MTEDTDGREPGSDLGLSRAVEILELSPDARREREVTDLDVQVALRTVIERGDEDDKQLGDVTLPALEYAYDVLSGENNHPVDLSGATIESLDLSNATVRAPFVLDGAAIGELDLDRATVEQDLSVRDATVGWLEAYETEFGGNAEFERTTFEGQVDAQEAAFADDVSFDDAVFEDEVVFDAAELYGDSNRLDDNTSFDGARFDAAVSFRQTDCEFTSFDDVTFAAEVTFEEARFDGDTNFVGTTFRAFADFDEGRFFGDTTFDGAVFEGEVDFRGAEFRGSARAIEDDLTFENAVFEREVEFRHAVFRYVDFAAATFEAPAIFELTTFRGDADFLEVTFEDLADFDEAHFEANADFTGTTFRTRCNFRGAEFRGGSNHLDVAATFEDVAFEGDAEFDDTYFSTAAFVDVIFSAFADFGGAIFDDEFRIEAVQRTNEAYVNFTDATLKEGRIVQPESSWVRFDLTQASIGDLELDVEVRSDRKELLDYFRFCETEFNEFDGYTFDFSNHTDYLDRNAWVLHDFDASRTDYEPAVPLTPETIERTYLKAKIAASSVGNQQAAGEFRVKRQQFARKKYWGIVGDATEATSTRLYNGARALENLFLDISCGFGLRLRRIIGVFVVFPLIPAVFYSFLGGPFRTNIPVVGPLGEYPLLTAEGLQYLYKNIYFSYITFLTVGYGNNAPVGYVARAMAALEVYIGVVLGGLLLYALIKRSEV
jgi:uncharacterized protein YjbI with pentapeptide repeats